jgi:PAS domain-containing protein
MATPQRSIELIHARNLMASLSTPAFLVDEEAVLVFYNEAAGKLLGRRFEDRGPVPAATWVREFGPVDREGNRLSIEELSTTIALRHGHPAHGRFCIHNLSDERHEIDLSAMPIVGSEGFRGAMAFFWPVESSS